MTIHSPTRRHHEGRRTKNRTLALLLGALILLLGACAPSMTIELMPDLRGPARVVEVPGYQATAVSVRPSRGQSFKIPPGHLPPPGKCRIWHPGTPPGHQPPPGNCATLERNVPEGAYLVRR